MEQDKVAILETGLLLLRQSLEACDASLALHDKQRANIQAARDSAQAKLEQLEAKLLRYKTIQ